MSSAREEILARIRRTTADSASSAAVDARLAQRPLGPQPAYAEADFERWLGRIQAVAATVTRLPRREDIPTAVADYLQAQGLPTELVLAEHAALHDLTWPAGLRAVQRPLTPDDPAVLTVADCAVAETGSLVLLSRAETPTRYNFLPDTCLCLLDARAIVGHIEDVWARLRERVDGMPRTVNLITGPSRTADVEQTIQLGAHGPRRLHVIVLEYSL